MNTAHAIAKGRLAALEMRLAASQKLFEDRLALFLARELEPDFNATLAAHRDLLERVVTAREEEKRLRPPPEPPKPPKHGHRIKDDWTF